MAKKFEKKITNKQGLLADPRKHYHTQGFTCDCKHCGVEFSQYHDKHVFCGEVCRLDHKGVAHHLQTCNDCGCVDDVANKPRGYVCDSCHKFRLNPERTDMVRRTSSAVPLLGDLGV